MLIKLSISLPEDKDILLSIIITLTNWSKDLEQRIPNSLLLFDMVNMLQYQKESCQARLIALITSLVGELENSLRILPLEKLLEEVEQLILSESVAKELMLLLKKLLEEVINGELEAVKRLNNRSNFQDLIDRSASLMVNGQGEQSDLVGQVEDLMIRFKDYLIN